MKPLHVVLIHGVGAPAPGSFLPSIEQGYAARPGATSGPFEQRSMPAGDRHYLGASPFPQEGARPVTFWDFNWSDISLAPKTWLGLLPFLVRLLVATVVVASRGWEGGRSGRRLLSASVFRWLFTLGLLWITIPVLLSLAEAMLDGWAFGAAGLALAAVTLWIAWAIHKIEPWAAEMGAAVAVGVLGLTVWSLWTGGSLAFLLDLPPWLQILLVLVGPALIVAAFLEGCFRIPWQALVSRIGLLVLAFALFSGVMATSLAGALYLATLRIGGADPFATPPRLSDDPAENASAQALSDWSQAYACSRPYHIEAVESATAWSTGAIGGLLLAAGLVWLLMCRREVRTAGAFLRACLRAIAWLIVLIFALFSVFLALDVAAAAGRVPVPRLLPHLGPPLIGETCEANLLRIYGLSMLRLVPFVLTAAMMPARIGFDVAADILLYLHDGSEVRRRLRAFLHELTENGDDVAVWGHSQGSRIAVDTLFWDKDAGAEPAPAQGRLATSGSPVRALYGGFLDHEDLPAPRPGWTWTNFWRGTDFVGGPIPSGNEWPRDRPVDENLRKHHTYYWIEPEVIAYLLAAPPPAGAPAGMP